MTPVSPPSEPRFDATFRDQLSQLFLWRRDVRHFDPEQIPQQVLDDLLALANCAPSVGLSQPWRFVTVDDPARRSSVREEFERCNAGALKAQATDRLSHYARLKLAGLDEAPCQLAVFVVRDPIQGHGLGRHTMPETLAFSAVIAIHSLWLAARAAGLGLGWVSILNPETMGEILDTPDDWNFIAYLCIGYPAANSDVPELEIEGWERRRPMQLLQR